MFFPLTADYMKREYYVSMVEKEERQELEKARKVVQSIIEEKKRHVTAEQVARYMFRVNLDRKID